MGVGKNEMFGFFPFVSSILLPFLLFLPSFLVSSFLMKKRGGGRTLTLSFHCFPKKVLTSCSGDTVITAQIPRWPHEL